MEILGSNFDDSVFAETRNRVSVVLPSYNAKFCEAQVSLEARMILFKILKRKPGAIE